MELSELLQVTGKVGPIVLGIATIATALLYVVNLVRKSYRATARARRAEKERDDAKKQKDHLERDLALLSSERDKLCIAIEEAKRAAEQHQKDAAKYFAAGRKEYLRRQEIESAGKTAHERAIKLTEELEKVTTELKQATERIETQQKDLERYEAQIDAVAKQDGRVWCAKPTVTPPNFVRRLQRIAQRPTIISMLNLKGGVGKTTVTANLGGYLAYHRKKWVLLLDLDHQRSLTQSIFTTEKRKDIAASRRTIQDFLCSKSKDKDFLSYAEQVQGDGFSRLWMLGNSDAEEGYGNTQNLDDLEMDLLGQWLLNPAKLDIRFLLREALHTPQIQERFEYVLIDCPPRLTTGCINALAASDFVLIPAQAEHIAASSVSHLLRRLRPLQHAGVLSELQVLGVLGNMMSADADDSKSREVKLLEQTAAAASVLWGSPVRLLESRIRESGNYARYQRDSEEKARTLLPGVAVGAIREQYAMLATEIEERVNEDLGVAGVSA